MLTNGSTFIGNFLNGLPHGLGYLVFKNGSEFYGQFQRGKFHGFGMFRYKSGDKIEGYFDQGTPPRSGKQYFHYAENRLVKNKLQASFNLVKQKWRILSCLRDSLLWQECSDPAIQEQCTKGSFKTGN